MAETPPTTPPPSDELTPQEKTKFSKFLGEFLADDDANQPPANQPAPPSAPPAQPGNIGEAIEAALDRRDQRTKQTETLANLIKDVGELKKNQPKQRHWWFRPFSPMGSND